MHLGAFWGCGLRRYVGYRGTVHWFADVNHVAANRATESVTNHDISAANFGTTFGTPSWYMGTVHRYVGNKRMPQYTLTRTNQTYKYPVQMATHPVPRACPQGGVPSQHATRGASVLHVQVITVSCGFTALKVS